jgi:hypothetical protein
MEGSYLTHKSQHEWIVNVGVLELLKKALLTSELKHGYCTFNIFVICQIDYSGSLRVSFSESI